MIKNLIIILVGITCLCIIGFSIFGSYYLLQNVILIELSRNVLLTISSISITTLIILLAFLIWGMCLSIKKEHQHANPKTD